MSIIDEIVERRIAQGVRDGMFDGLEGHGKPINDLDQRRPEGWFAARLVRNEVGVEEVSVIVRSSHRRRRARAR